MPTVAKASMERTKDATSEFFNELAKRGHEPLPRVPPGRCVSISRTGNGWSTGTSP